MPDDESPTSHPAKEKPDSEKVHEEKEPKEHESEAGGDPGEGRTGTKQGSTDS